MSFEIGPLPPLHPASAVRRTPAPPSTGFGAELARAGGTPAPRVDTAEVSMFGSPPPEVLDAVGAAADRVAELAAANRELHFSVDEESGRVVVEVRDFEGNVIRTIPPSEALEVMAGARV